MRDTRKFAVPSVFLAVGLVASTCYGHAPWSTGVTLTGVTGHAADVVEQPDGVTVTIEDGHAIIDFSERAHARADAAMQFISPLGPDVETPEDQWEARIPSLLQECLSFCDHIADPDLYDSCIFDCYDRYGKPSAEK